MSDADFGELPSMNTRKNQRPRTRRSLRLEQMEKRLPLAGEGATRARIELERKGNDESKMEVRLTGAPANESFDVVVGGQTLGLIHTDSKGRGELEIQYGGERPELPEVLAAADWATTVSIGDLVSGTLGSLGEMQSSDGGSDDSSSRRQ